MASESRVDNAHADSVDNVFEALSLPNPDEEMVRCELVSQILHIGRELGLEDAALADRVGCSLQRIAQLRSVEFEDVTIDELCRYLVALGHGVQIVVGPRLDSDAHMIAVTE